LAANKHSKKQNSRFIRHYIPLSLLLIEHKQKATYKAEFLY